MFYLVNLYSDPDLKSLVNEDIYQKYKNISLKKCSDYVGLVINNKIQRLSHLVLGKPQKGFVVDHINGDKLDNRRENLRFCTYSENSQNVKGQGTSNFKNVSLVKSNQMWQVRVRKDGILHYGGQFENENDVAYPANVMMKILYRDCCNLNLNEDGEQLTPSDTYLRKMSSRDIFIIGSKRIPKLNSIKMQIVDEIDSHYVCSTTNSKDKFKISKSTWDKYKYCTCNNNGRGYIRLKLDGNRWEMLHRLVLGYTGELIVDHINRDKMDNRIENLRIVTPSQNTQNSTTKNKTGYTGVKLVGKNYQINICLNGKSGLSCGTYPSKELAAWGYNQIAIKLYGEYCKVNDCQDFSDSHKIIPIEGKLTYRVVKKDD